MPSQDAAADLRPVTVAVVDSKSGTPIKEFTYQASYEAPGREGPAQGDAWTPITSPSGTFEIKTPQACRLIVMAKAPDYIGGYPMENEFVIKKDDVARRVVVRLRKGITVKGTVLDSRTKPPVAGATVAPMIHELPIWVPDEDKEVKTGRTATRSAGSTPNWASPRRIPTMCVTWLSPTVRQSGRTTTSL